MTSTNQQPSAPVPILSEQEAAAISIPVSIVVLVDWARLLMIRRAIPVKKICCKKHTTVTTHCRTVLMCFLYKQLISV